MHEIPVPTAPLAGRVAVVTGGASSIARATARALQGAGAAVALLDSGSAALERAAAEINAHAFAIDMVDGPAMEHVFDDIHNRLGNVSILVNCAGESDAGAVVTRGAAMCLDDFRHVIETNLLSAINSIRCAVPHMIGGRASTEAEAGVIINTASIAAFDGQAGHVAYAASKGGVAGMVLPLARELGEHGIRVMGIALGVFESDAATARQSHARDELTAVAAPYPKRMGHADEYAALVWAIVGNPMLNGEVIRLDGALRLPARLSHQGDAV